MTRIEGSSRSASAMRPLRESPARLVELLAHTRGGPDLSGLPAEAEDLGRGHLVHEDAVEIWQAPPVSILVAVCVADASSRRLVGHHIGRTLDHDVQSFVELVAARRDGDLSVLCKVHR